MQLTQEHLDQAYRLGADTALSVATWATMGEREALYFATGDDVDPEVLDRFPAPDLSGGWADDATPDSLYRGIVGEDVGEDTDGRDALADAWEAGRDAVWSDALQAFALRLRGDIPAAMAIEARNDAEAQEGRCRVD